jgi:predicted nucleotidyltransferase
MDLRQLEALLAAKLGADTNIAAVYLFGSRARGAPRDGSDVDLGVLYRVAPPATLLGQPFELQAALSSELGLPVDVVVMNNAPVDLVHRVLRDGRLVLEQDRSGRIAFEVKARNQYFDLLPILQRYRRRTA